MDVLLALANFWWAGLPCVTALRLEKFREDTPTSPEVIEAHTLNFRPDFYFSRLKFLGGPPSQLGYALCSLGQSLARVNAAPPRAEI